MQGAFWHTSIWDGIQALVLGCCFAVGGKRAVLCELLCTCAGCCQHVSVLLRADTCPLHAVEVVGLLTACLLDGLSVKASPKLTKEKKLASSAAQGGCQSPVSC